MKHYEIRYSPAARKDLDDVWDGVFEASRDFDTADAYIEGLVNAVSEKKKYPERGIPLYYRGLFTGFHSVNFKAYKVFYRIRDNYVEVIRIIMSKRDYMKILFEDE